MGGLSGSALLQRVGDGNKVQQFVALLKGRLPGRSYRLLYTWSRDGRSGPSFHQRCDNQVRARAFARAAAARLTAGQGPTLVIVRSTTGHTFGGYASAPWNSADDWIDAAGCFLFLVENPHGDAPTCFECKDNGYAMYGSSAWGPLFGGGAGDLYISSDGSSSWTALSYSYTNTLGRGNATFTGATYFTLEDYEVWAAAT